jgi:hypothetical protein
MSGRSIRRTRPIPEANYPKGVAVRGDKIAQGVVGRDILIGEFKIGGAVGLSDGVANVLAVGIAFLFD